MKASAKTIQIFLPNGDPHGIRTAELTTRIVQVLEVPRSLLPDFFQMPESDQVALYFLFGQQGDAGDSRVYIGQTGDLRARLASHHQKKDFWERALVLMSRTISLTQTHALLLEWYCLQEANRAGRFIVENGNGGTKPHTPAPLQADCLEIYETGRTLLATLGYPLFDTLVACGVGAHEEELLHLTVAGVEGRGSYTQEGFVVRTGSRGKLAHSPTFSESNQRFRQRLLDSRVMRPVGNAVVFHQKDHLFGSPSMAAMALLGRSSNGWKEWKSPDGTTLHELKRETGETDA